MRYGSMADTLDVQIKGTKVFEEPHRPVPPSGRTAVRSFLRARAIFVPSINVQSSHTFQNET